MHIRIEDEHDGFRITMRAYTGADMVTLQAREKTWRFDQEDSRQQLVEVFRSLGVTNVTYEEVY